MNKDTGVDTKQVVGADDAEFQEIATERFMYNAEKCGGAPLVGWLVNCLPMPPINNRAWNAFLIRTTRPTKVVDREDNVISVEADTEVLIPATFQLTSHFAKAAASDRVYEVRIVPDAKVSIGGGQHMWTYKLAAKPGGKPRSEFGLAAVLAPSMLMPATASSGGDKIPF